MAGRLLAKHAGTAGRIRLGEKYPRVRGGHAGHGEIDRGSPHRSIREDSTWYRADYTPRSRTAGGSQRISPGAVCAGAPVAGCVEGNLDSPFAGSATKLL